MLTRRTASVRRIKSALCNEGRLYTVFIRDVKTPKFFGPAHNKIFYFRPVWASENILSSMFYNKTTNYLSIELTDLQRRRLDFGSREEHTAKNYSTGTLKIFYIQIGIHNF